MLYCGCQKLSFCDLQVLVDGPLSGVKRQAMRLRLLHLTDFVIKIPHSAREKTVKKAWTDTKIDERWQKTVWCQKLEAKKRVSITEEVECTFIKN